MTATPSADGSTLAARARFSQRLADEHLAEAGFLYEQRLTLRRDPGRGWRTVEDWERRIAPHLDALRRARALASDELRASALDDAGRLHALVRAVCAANDFEATRAVLTTALSIAPLAAVPQSGDDGNEWDDRRAIPLLDGTPQGALSPPSGAAVEVPAATAAAIFDALAVDLPRDWLSRFGPLAARAPLLGDMLWRVCGHRRWHPRPDELTPRAHASPGRCFAAGRLGDRSALALLAEAARVGSPDLRREAAIASLRLGERRFVAQLDRRSLEPWAAMPVALGGGPEDARELASAPPDGLVPEAILALGVLGDVTAVPTLITVLADPSRAAIATLALDLVTGAGLQETVFIADDLHEGELGDREAAQPPPPPDGETVTRLSRNPEQWGAWWTSHERRMDPLVRWRRGRPCSVAALLEELLEPRYPALVRDIAFDELAIRYGIDAGIEPDAPVATQLSTLDQLRKRPASSDRPLVAGRWYFAGHDLRDPSRWY